MLETGLQQVTKAYVCRVAERRERRVGVKRMIIYNIIYPTGLARADLTKLDLYPPPLLPNTYHISRLPAWIDSFVSARLVSKKLPRLDARAYIPLKAPFTSTLYRIKNR